jgi:hypothetical protein
MSRRRLTLPLKMAVIAAALAGCARETALDWAGRVAKGAAHNRCAFDDHCVSERELERYRLHRREPGG